MSQNPKLTKEILSPLINKGLNGREIAETLGYSISYIQHLMSRLNLKCISKDKYKKDKIEKAVKDSLCFKDVCRNLDISHQGGAYIKLKILIKKYNIDCSHFLGSSAYSGKRRKNYQPAKNVLHDKHEFRVSSEQLRSQMLANGFEYICVECGQQPVWNNKPLTLHIDHINGNNCDNRKENLRFLCPHCHSQTPNFGSKNSKRNKKIYYCLCGNKKEKKSISCQQCCVLRKNDKIPKKEELENLIWVIPSTHIAKKYGVSDRAIGKWCVKYNIAKPPRGYWLKNKVV